VRSHHCLGNGKPQTQPTKLSRDRALPLLEGIENLANLRGVDPDAVVDGSNGDSMVTQI